jgi:hypothetical protein
MLRRVKIKKLPQAKTGFQVEGSLYNDVPAMGGGADYNAYIGKPNLKLSKYITAVPRKEANLEAEGGETVFGDINGDGMPEHKVIKGPRHSEGGVPLNLPDDTFIFSDTKGMKIKDPNFLVTFGKKSGSYTPAALAKQYDIDRYRKILQDPDSDVLDRKTAELMIKNYNIKLGALALAQESKKGFPQGIPAVAKPYMDAMGINPEQILPSQQMRDAVDELNSQQTNNERSAATMASPTEEEDNMFGANAEEAQMINSDRPVAQPEPEVDEEAGMTPEETQMQFGGMMTENSGWMPDEIAVFTGNIPYAAYGMAMGANPQNYEGRDRRIPAATRFFQGGGDVKVDVSGMTPEQKQAAYDKARIKNPGKQIVSVEGGKETKLKHSRAIGTDIEGVNVAEFGDAKNPNAVAAAATYKILQSKLDDPEVSKALCDETTASLTNPKSYVGKDGKQQKTWTQRGNKMPDCDQIKNQFLTHQKRNLAFKGRSVDPQLFTDTGQGLAPAEDILKRGALNPQTGQPIKDLEEAKKVKEYMRSTYGGGRSGYKNKKGEIIDVSIDEVSGKIGLPLDKDPNSRALQQATFHGYTHMNDKAKTYGEDLQVKLSGFLGNQQIGVTDESSMTGLFDTKGVQVSPIDDFGKPEEGKYGNTTLGHLAAAGVDKYDPILEEPEKKPDAETKPEDKPGEQKECPCEKQDGTVVYVGKNPNTGECNPCEEEVKVDVEQPAEWWLQDTIKTTGAFGDLMSIKKHMPWAPRVDLETPRPTFLDPTRELAANAEQANIQTQGMAQFAGPQAMSARSSSVQGQAAKNAADVLSRYNNANVNIANQFETQATNIRNQEQGMNQAATQRLYDQNTIANQQFDNAKLAMRNNLRNQYVNAITNRAQTDTLNKLYPQFAVQPGTGGFLVNKPGKELTGESTTGPDYWAQRKKCVDEGAADPDACAKNAMQTGSAGGTTTNKGAIAKEMGYGKFGGYMKEGGFAYADIAYPFIL